MSGDGTLIGGRFETIRRLGAGGMGSVALAEDHVLGRLVAIKRLHPGSGPELARRFRREMKFAASMAHPNIVGLLDAIEEGGDVFLVMEYVDGQTLAQRLRQSPVAPDEALAILRPLGDAVDAIHARGVVHRDIKPSNILVAADGTPKLADLGLARAADRSGLTTTSGVLGTPAYTAPELFQHAAPSPAADVWSLAAVAYELLSGHRARTGTTPAAVAYEASRDVPIDLAERWGDAPELEAVLRRGLDRDPARRPPSARALVAEIAQALRDDAGRGRAAVAAAPPTRPTAPVAPARRRAAAPPPEPRRRSLLPFAVAALLAVLAGTIVAIVATGGSGDPPRRAATATSEPKATTTAPRRTTTTTTQTQPAQTQTQAETEPAQTQQTQTQPQTPTQSHQSAAAATPDAAVRSFYTLAAGDRYRDAWAMAGPGVRSQLGGYAAFRRQFGTLQRIDFASLRASGTRVFFTTTATHSDHVDHCTGSATTARSGGGYVVSHLSVSC